MNTKERNGVKKLIFPLFLLALIIFFIVDATRTAPNLHLTLITEDAESVNFRAIQLGQSWCTMLICFNSDSPHPLQLSSHEFEYTTFYLDDSMGEIRLRFRPNNQPNYIRILRWRVDPSDYLIDDEDNYNEYEYVEVIDNIIFVIGDSHDYIYEIDARWDRGRAIYTFRINSAE